MKNYQRWDNQIPYLLTLGVLKLYITLFRLHCNVSSVDQLPPGPKILAFNHPNVTDVFFIPLVFSERFFTLIQGNIFDIPVFGWLLSKSDQIPVISGKKLDAFWKACEVLRQGHTVMIFPEGRLNPKQISLKAESGAVHLSMKTGAPILPAGIYVADQDTLNIEYWENNKQHCGRCQIHGCCYIRVGQPWYPAQETGELNGRTAERLTEVLMEKIYSLSSQAALQARSQQAISLSVSASG